LRDSRISRALRGSWREKIRRLAKPAALCALALLCVFALFCALASCRRNANIPALELAEIADVAVAAALEAQKSGDYARAYDLLDTVTLVHPTNASAHLLAAILLQDVRNDHATAIHHLRAYIRLRPESDKALLAAERLELAKSRLAGVGVDHPDIANANATLKEELRRTQNTLEKSIDERIALDTRIRKLEDDIERLQKENLRLREIWEMMQITSPPPGPLTGELPTQVRTPLTYQVRPGDTLWSIANEFFLDGTRAAEIRAANADKIPADNILIPGTILKIPRR